MLAPSIRLRTQPVDESELPVGVSKIGGMSDLPSRVEWPEAGGRALPFVAQIHLADVAPYDIEGALPHTGMLYFFFDQDAYSDYWAERQLFSRVLYTDVDAAQLERRVFPASLAPKTRYAPLGVTFASEITMPSFESPDIERLGFTLVSVFGSVEDGQLKREDERLLELLDAIDATLGKVYGNQEAMHRMLGHPDPIQGSVQGEWHASASRQDDDASGTHRPRSMHSPPSELDWRLLLQIDSEERPMIWGDVGCIYYGILRDALARRDFTQTCLTLQCT